VPTVEFHLDVAKLQHPKARASAETQRSRGGGKRKKSPEGSIENRWTLEQKSRLETAKGLRGGGWVEVSGTGALLETLATGAAEKLRLELNGDDPASIFLTGGWNWHVISGRTLLHKPKGPYATSTGQRVEWLKELLEGIAQRTGEFGGWVTTCRPQRGRNREWKSPST